MTSKLQQELRDDDPLAALAAMSGVKDRQQVSADDDGEVERRTVTLDDFTIDPEIQVRLGGPDLEYAEELSQILINGGRYRDPIVLFRDEDGQRWLADGFNRCDGLVIAQRAVPEIQEIDAVIYPGGRDAAIEYAETANLQHGKVLTTEERRGIFERRVKRGHAWTMLSTRAIAAELRVSHQTVARWRNDLESDLSVTNVTDSDAGKRLVRRGDTVYEQDITNVRKSNALRAARQALGKIVLPTLDFDTHREIVSALSASVEYIKLAELGGGDTPGHYRAYLPYALGIELEQHEPRISLVEWMRSELPAWQAEQEEEAALRAQVAQARDRMLAILVTGPRRDLYRHMKEFTDTAKDGAYIQLLDEGLIVADGDYTRLAASPEVASDQEERDAVDVVRESILAALCGGAKGPAELKYELGAVSDVIYQVARDSLLQEGLIVRDKDLHSGRVTYRAANASDDCDAAPAAPAPVEPAEQGFKWQGVETAKTALLNALQDGPLKAHDLRAAVEAQGVGYQPHLDARNQLEAAGRIVYELVDGSATYRLASQAAAPTLPPGVTLDRLGTDAHSADHDVELEQAYRTLAQLEKAALDVRDAIAALRVVNSIRTLYRLDAVRFDQLDTLLAGTWNQLMDAPEHVEKLRQKLDIMRQTGAPYEE